jgi:FkbH-like protein
MQLRGTRSDMVNKSRTAVVLDSLISRLRRDHDLPFSYKAVKALRYVVGRMVAPFVLLGCDRVGRGARVRGRPVVVNAGIMEIGENANIASMFSPVRLVTGLRGRLDIGRDVTINFGTTIVACSRVHIGDRVSLGPYVEIIADDEDIHSCGIDVGNDVWLAARVRVMKGVSIGEGTVVAAGSLVTTSLPAGVIAAGDPARVVRRRNAASTMARRPTIEAAGSELAQSTGAPCAVPRPTGNEDPAVRGLLISDFSVQELAALLRRVDELGPAIDVDVAPFDQVVQTLHKLIDEEAGNGPDFALIWTRPEAAIPGFRALLAHEHVDVADILAEVDGYAALLAHASRSLRSTFVPTWVLTPGQYGVGMQDMRPGGIVHTLMLMNLRLAAAFDQVPSLYVLDAQRWLSAGRFDPKLWYLAKVGFSREVFAEAAEDIKSGLRALAGVARKLVIVDLDDTLWGGVVGDVGWQHLRLGGHDGLGEAFVDFQRQLKTLTRRGVILAIASKNEESVALTAIANHPEMVLRPDDFSAHRVNWNDKATNILAIAKELNLGLQSVVFIDDNPLERARVREALPDVFVPEWPEDKLLSAITLRRLRCFDSPRISHEDSSRTMFYALERKRKQEKDQFRSLDDWLVGLNTCVRFAQLDPVNLPRVTQLLNKTNQMNLRTRRLSETELWDWANEPGNEVWAVHVSDKYGDAGLTGILSLEERDDTLLIADYVLSCRVMGRKVEETIVAAAISRARERHAHVLVADYRATEKNKPCLDFWMRSGFRINEHDASFRWNPDDAYLAPDCISVVGLPLSSKDPAASTEFEPADERGERYAVGL